MSIVVLKLPDVKGIAENVHIDVRVVKEKSSNVGEGESEGYETIK
jgi:hypothetical protein